MRKVWLLKVGVKRKTRRESSAERNLSMMAEMETQAGAARIVTVDIDLPLPDLQADERYRNAWVVLCKAGVPRSVVMLDLTEDAVAIEDRLQKSLTRAKAAEPSILDRALPSDLRLPRITIVIPTIVSRVEDLGLCLDAIEQLDYPDFEVVLVDNRRVVPFPDPLPALVHDRRRLRVIRESRPGISAARNAGVAEADGDVIAFTDDDVRVERQWLRAIGLRMALDPELDALTGLILPAELESPTQIWFERYTRGEMRTFSPVTLETDSTSRRLLRGSRVRVYDSDGNTIKLFSVLAIGSYGAGANMAFRKSALERVGGFDVVLGIGTPAFGGEDLATLITILWTGGRIAYEPAAYVTHRHRREFDDLLKQLDGYGLSFAAMMISVVRSHPRRTLAVLSQLPRIVIWKVAQAIHLIRRRRTDGVDGNLVTPDYPIALFRRELRSLLSGPLAYRRSCKAWRLVSATSSNAKD